MDRTRWILAACLALVVPGACAGGGQDDWCEGTVWHHYSRTCDGGPLTQTCETQRWSKECAPERACATVRGLTNCWVWPIQACDAIACTEDGRGYRDCLNGAVMQVWPCDPEETCSTHAQYGTGCWAPGWEDAAGPGSDADVPTATGE